MNSDTMTQNIIATVIVAIAIVYIGVRIYRRLASKNGNTPDCGCGCSGNCSGCSGTMTKKED